MKKLTVFLLTAIILLSVVLPAFIAQPTSAAPLYTYIATYYQNFDIDDNGNMSITIRCMRNSNTTSISTVTYVQRKMGTVWITINTPERDNRWTETTTALVLEKNYSHQVRLTGEYRLVTEFTVYSGTQRETITATMEASYF